FFKDYETVFEANEIDLIIEKNLFEKEVKTKKILIFGQPGIGKKTLCQYLTYQWWGDCGAWKERFDLVVRINLRNLTKEKYRDRNISLEEIIVCEYFHSTKQKNHQEMEHIRKALHCTPNKKKLFLFVGYDELLDNSPCKTTIDNFLFKEKKFYEENNFYFILTSRPNALIRSENFDFHLRCIGFGSEKIPAYLKTQNVCANSETAQKIVGFLKEREEIHNLAHIPTLLDSLAVTKQKIFASEPDKIRKLYECIVNKLWERHQSKLRELNFSDEDINKRQEQAEKLLKALAFDSLLRKKIVFSHKFVKKVARNTFNCRDLEAASKVKDLMSPGFLNCYRRSPHEENKYLFLHLTIQEYLANLYISDWSSKNAKIDIYNPSTKKKAQSTAEEFISTYKDNSHFQGVWLFC
ncbi:MAG: NACHT domain-containing protein, partial [Parachlamydiaceae bacterium]